MNAEKTYTVDKLLIFHGMMTLKIGAYSVCQSQVVLTEEIVVIRYVGTVRYEVFHLKRSGHSQSDYLNTLEMRMILRG